MRWRPGLSDRLFADSVLPCALAALALLAALAVQRARMFERDAEAQAIVQLERLDGALARAEGESPQALLDRALAADPSGTLRRIEWQPAGGRMLSSGTAPSRPLRTYQRQLARAHGAPQTLRLQFDPQPLQRALRGVWAGGALCAAGIVLLALLARWSLRRQVADPMRRLHGQLGALLAGYVPPAPAEPVGFAQLQSLVPRLAAQREARLRDWEAIRRSSASNALAQQRLAQAATHGKAQFMALVGHHFRQPLQALRLLSVCLQPGDEAEQRATLAQIRASIGRMTRLLDALLEISRLDAGVVTLSAREFEAAELFERDRQALLAKAVRQGVTLHWRGGHHRLHGDLQLAADLVRQLADNAIAHATGGRVLVAARRGRHAVHIEVRDNGEGIAPAHQQRIFEEFVRLPGKDGEREGYGLGLTIAARLASVLGTRIELRSAPGCGSTFRFSLPQPALPRSAHAHGRRHRRLRPRLG
ncbi:hypothetical protein ASG87_13575 [Frateuria sp. Soil773]|uniref:sensor histidine kinase n=1 Tax=Frateuria sp. Soil773 TaxID=1736407 RepID=UPI0006FE484C|nr:HAMP domain-containing sensor histidine kinase [Frateuria sp. Soil773]KRF00357.1 hypothetical protein ASG87_13575 [Frateuria sp. Soil773]